ncbi:MAG TPA: hypothetical protein VHL52_05130 [Acidimicrobiia bacterium]|nr:hypothetical protein [Acidimicrobiia bacterium]
MTDLRSQLRLVKHSSRRLGGAAAVLGLSALVHVVVLLVDGGGWEGAVTFRKPITFGISVGLLLWTCGWILDRLPPRPRIEGALAWPLIVSGVIEVALITVQAWRGVPSHFNVFTPEDGLIFSLMGISIGVLSAALGLLFLWTLIQRPADRPTRLAVIAGMTLVILGLGVGAWIIELGVEMTERLGRVPDTVLAGDAGVAKFPHAMALHGIQLFIGVSVLGRRLGLDDRARLRVTRLTTGGYASLVTWAVVHTNAGRAPTDLSGVEASLLGGGVLLLVAACGLMVAAFGRTPAGEPGRPAVTLSS